MLAVFKSKEIFEFVLKEEKDFAHQERERDSSGAAHVFLSQDRLPEDQQALEDDMSKGQME